jgi:predicted SnoaL-like aldol condensation-catalyzing enzyme
MSIEENKQVVLDFIEAQGRGDIDAAAAYYADNGINHGMEVTRDQIRRVLQDLITTFGNRSTKIKTIVADEEWVVLRTIMSGKHAGTNVIPIHMLTPGTEPTGKPFSVQVIHMFRLADGKITEHWAGRDDLGLHWQLGLIPMPDWYKARMG